MQIVIDIETGNSAFEDYQTEVERILTIIVGKITESYTFALIHDINGNEVGQWSANYESEK